MKDIYTLSKAGYFTNPQTNMAQTLVATDWKDPQAVGGELPVNNKTFRGVNRNEYEECDKAGPKRVCSNDETLVAAIEGNGIRPSHRGAGIKEGNMYTLNGTEQHAVATEKVVRRLTPLECCRLQGFPDDWCDGVEGSDSAQYKMWGNGVGLPCVLYIMEGIKEAGDKYNL